MVRSEWLALEPRDTVLVRDGRQFDAGADATAEPVLPGPSTVAGAAFAAYGARDPEPEAIRGPVLARWNRATEAWVGLFPAPADLVHPGGGENAVRRLRPVALAATTDLSEHCPQWLVGEGDPVRAWLPAATLSAYLCGELLAGGDEADTDDLAVEFGPGARYADPMARERRIGLARTEDRVAKDHFLYQSTHLRPRDGIALLAECELPAGWDRSPRGPVPVGGRARLADVTVATGVGWPERPDNFPDGRVLVYVATPALWPEGWKIPLPDGVHLVAAAAGEPEVIATASPRQGMDGSRALRWAAPAGSVYLLRFGGADGPAAALRWAEAVHGKAYGEKSDSQEHRRLRTAGFGVILTGVW